MADGSRARESEFNEQDLGALLKQDIAAALTYDQTELSQRRARAIEYYRGEMNDTPSRPNGSTATSRDLADTMSWILPSAMRVFMAGDRMAEYEPVAPDTDDPAMVKQAEEQADQASDFAQYVFMKDNPGYRIVYNATWDSLLTGNGIVKHWADKTPKREMSFHSYLTVDDITALMDKYDDADVKIISKEKNEYPELVPNDETGALEPQPTWDVKIERTTSHCQFRVESIEPENFLIDKAAVTIDDAVFVAHRDPYMTRSKLIEMGFKRSQVDMLAADSSPIMRTEEGFSRRQADPFVTNDNVKSTERLDYYECYRKIDVDGDGIAEWIKVHYVDPEVLDWEVWEDDIPFTDIPCYPVPHDYAAQSVADRTMDIQQIKTVLLREGLNNTYASNLPMREVEEQSVLNPDILVSPKFGGTIWKKRGSAPIVNYEVKYTADKSFAGMEMQDRINARRTGVSSMSMGLDPEVLQNQSATANQNAHDASLSQAELVARNMAELGWTRVFTKLLQLFVKHQDRPRMLLLRKKLVKMDPRHWNANMGVTVNTGLGTGSRHRDMQALQVVKMDQMAMIDRFAATGFPDEALKMVPLLRKTLVKAAESAGLRNPDQFYPDYDDQKLQQMMQRIQQKAQQPPLEVQLEQMKAQAQAQTKQMELAAEAQFKTQELGIQAEAEKIKAQGAAVKEAAQLQADLQTAAADREKEITLKTMDIGVKREEIASRERIAFHQAAMQQQQAAEDRASNERNEGMKVAADAQNKEADREVTRETARDARMEKGLPAGDGKQPKKKHPFETLSESMSKPKRFKFTRGTDGRIDGAEQQ